LPLAQRILSHAGVSGLSGAQLAAVITPCNSSARQIKDAVAKLALGALKAVSFHITLKGASRFMI